MKKEFRKKAKVKAKESVKRENLVVTRVFEARVEQVWNAWTDCQQLMRWWGPNGYTAPICEMDLRVGGKSLLCMRSPEGQDFYSTWTYQEIIPMERIEFIDSLTDKDGKKIDPATLGLPPDFPQDLRTTVTLKDTLGKTEMTFVEYDWTVGQMLELSKIGLNQSLDKMAASLAEA